MRLAAATLLLALAPRQEGPYDKFGPVKELPSDTSRFVMDSDGRWIWSEGGVIVSQDWSIQRQVTDVADISFLKSGKEAVVATRTNGLWIYKTSDWKAIPESGQGGSFLCGDLSDDRRVLVGSGPFKDSICVFTEWDKADRKREVRKGGELALLRFVSKSRFVSLSRGGRLDLWEPDKDEPVKTLDLGGMPSGFALSPDRDVLFAATGTQLRRIQTADFKELTVEQEDLPARPSMDTDGRRLVVWGGDGKVMAFSGDKLERIATPGGGEGRFRLASLAPDGKWLACAHADEPMITVFDTVSWDAKGSLRLLGAPKAIAMGARGKWILACVPPKTYVYQQTRR